jgi:hypothetical protein
MAVAGNVFDVHALGLAWLWLAVHSCSCTTYLASPPWDLDCHGRHGCLPQLSLQTRRMWYDGSTMPYLC